MKGAWYADWFDTPYYHLLYNKRDECEAKDFISRICSFLKLEPGSKLWDVGCGRGRHAVALNELGYDVTGTDLSPNNIAEASRNANDSLRFVIHDMRTPFRQSEFDAAFNLFTSIGYFSDHNDNYMVFRHVSNSLKPNGVFVLDFFNAACVKSAPVHEQEVRRGDIVFRISKSVSNGVVTKKISFNDKQRTHHYEERVSLLGSEDFGAFAAQAGMKPTHVFGDYKLGSFDPDRSERLIILFNKSV